MSIENILKEMQQQIIENQRKQKYTEMKFGNL